MLEQLERLSKVLYGDDLQIEIVEQALRLKNYTKALKLWVVNDLVDLDIVLTF